MLKERDTLQKSMDVAKEQLKKLLKVKDTDDCIRLYYENLCTPDKDFRLTETKENLFRVISYKNEMRNRVLQKKQKCRPKKRLFPEKSRSLTGKLNCS